ncbi:glutathione peroxidase [alpha proteobacterium AAP81b]|nr:glutathione peroxidase [alpha proteobacterium AAP81b]
MTDIYAFNARDIAGRERSLGEWRGQVLLLVNTASKCGFTPQYAGLEALQTRFAARGFSVLGFPCNQFAGQEPGDEAEIADFCKLTYDVDFPLFAKIDVNGGEAHPLWQALKKAAPGLLGTEAIKWNFTKFLVDRSGRVVRRFGPRDTPEAIVPAIEALL